jgi:hypothetical protein
VSLGLGPIALLPVDLGQAKVSRSAEVEELIGQGAVHLDRFGASPEGMQQLGQGELVPFVGEKGRVCFLAIVRLVPELQRLEDSQRLFRVSLCAADLGPHDSTQITDEGRFV